MGKYPVISISLKGINAATYKDAFDFAVQIMKEVAATMQFLLESKQLSAYDKSEYRKLLDDNMSEAVFCSSLKKLSILLEKHYGTKVILLIDEYDVPLAKAFENGYYDQMIFLIRSLLEQALKTNNSLKFAVMTGCMRISKESIFTGLNNLKVLSITDERYDEYFGFTDTEVREMLKYYEIEDHYEEVKNWYDGYQFDGVEVYCPWDVLNYCDKLKDHAVSFPENYWINTSSNDAVKKFIQMSGNFKTKREIEALLAGEEIIKEIHQELVYPKMYQSLEDVVPVPKDLTTKVLQKKYLGIESDIIKQQRVRNKNNDFSTEISYAKRTEKKEIEAIMDDVRENDQCLFFVGVTIILMAESKKELESVCETVETSKGYAFV